MPPRDGRRLFAGRVDGGRIMARVAPLVVPNTWAPANVLGRDGDDVFPTGLRSRA